MRTAWIRGAALLAICTLRCAPATPPAVRLGGEVMGTTWMAKVAALPTGSSREDVERAVQETLERVDRHMSHWKPDSDVSRFNTARTTDWFDVDRETVAVVARALEISRQTDGAFDVTVAPLVAEWGFGPGSVADAAPQEERVRAARTHVGSSGLEARAAPPALRKSDPELALDLSAIAKGYGVDRAAQTLRDAGVSGFLVEVGGEVVTCGTRADGRPWQVGIERPVVDERRIELTVSPGDGALATSGDYRNFRELEGERYSHSIDPRTGEPVRHSLASVSVLADECIDADAYSTALMVLGPKDGFEFAEEHQLAALFLVRTENGFETLRTAAWQRTQEKP